MEYWISRALVYVLLSATALVAEPSKPAAAKKAMADKPNILFILADDLGYNDVSCNGATRIKTPNIDRLANEGIRFSDGHCGASTCTPTRYSLLTGRHNWRSWLKFSALSTSAPLLIEEDRVTIASFLRSEGYNTSIVGKWHLGYGREDGFEENRGNQPPNYWETRGNGPNWNGELKPGPNEVGFDYSYVIPVANSFPPYVIVENHYVEGLRKESPIGKMQSRNMGKMEGGEGARWKDEELVDTLTRKTVAELERLAKEDKPFFLYYTPHQPHIPHKPHPRFYGTSQAGRYGDFVQELDWSMGEVLGTLDRLGLTQNTLVIFTSDNGGAGRNYNGHNPNAPLRGGKGSLTEGGHRVPFIARWPDRTKAGQTSMQLVSTTDMLATFAAILGKELPEGAGPDSYNVLPALLGQKLLHPERPVVFCSGGTGQLAMRSGKWKLMVGHGECGYREFFGRTRPAPGTPPAQLYDLDADLGETRNLYAEHPEIVHSLITTLQKIKADENYNPTEPEQPEETLSIDELNALFPRLPTAAKPKPKKPPIQTKLKTPSTLKAIGGKVLEVSSFNERREPKYLTDGDLATFWHTRFQPELAKPPHHVVLQVPGKQAIKGLSYYAWAGGNDNGHIKGCSVYVSDDGKSWGEPVVKAVLKPNVYTEQTILFPEPTKKRFIKLVATDTIGPGGNAFAAIGELDVVVE